MKLMTSAAARAAMLAGLSPLAEEQVTLAEARGRVLARTVVASRDQPPFAASAMDGWAVRAADTPGRLTIAGESAAGRAYGHRLGAGEAVRIFTGAPMPAGADAVVIQEDAQREGDVVTVPAAEEGRHVRPAGLDFRAGDVLLTPGVRLDPWRIALAASAGRAELEVCRQPRVAVLATGDELAAPGTEPGPDQIFESGSATLAAVIADAGGLAIVLPRAGDDIQAIARTVGRAAADLIVTVGGASVGDHDLVKPALATLGLELIVESVAMRPGKPTWFGTLARGAPVLGLPGNPASAMVGCELFLKPLLAALQGVAAEPAMIVASAAGSLPANGDREHWMRARLSEDGEGGRLATPFGDQDSSLIAVFAQADALVRRAPHAAAVAAGEPVDVLPLARL